MKTLIIILAVLLSAPLFAETYTDTEFIVEGEPGATTTTCAPAVTTTTTTCPVSTTVVTTTSTVPAGSPIYVGMSKQLLVQKIGQPTRVDKFKRFAARKQGIYDEIWTYQTPVGVTYVYIKERRVAKIEYR